MIACVLSTVHVSHDNRIFFKEIPALLRAGYQVTYIVCCPSGIEPLPGLHVVPLPRVPRWQRPLNWWRALKAALRSKADIFHFHDPELIGVGLLLQRITGRPVIYDIHENYPEAMLYKPWIPRWLRPAVSRGVRLGEWIAVRSFDGSVIANPPTYERFRHTKRPLALVANFVELGDFDERQEAPLLSLELPYFIYTGSLSRERGALDCLAALELLTAKGREAELVLVGRIDDADPSVAGLPDRLPRGAYLVPPQPFRRLPPLLRRARAGLVTLYANPNYLLILPTKLLEYMAASIPVIAHDLPLVRPIVEETGCGLLVKPGDVERLSEAMGYLLDHPREAEEMGRRGRQAVVERYSWEAEATKLIALYRNLLVRKGQPATMRTFE